jgi:adenylosuccinate synthase
MKKYTRQVVTLTDLGPGDGGKGGALHALVGRLHPHTVVKVGGAQGSHGVWTNSGEKFAFSQFGCGTLDGAQTHISDRFVFYPSAILREAQALRYELGVYEPMRLLTVDEGALVATPFHGIASRLQELARGNAPRGSVGTGVGTAYLDREVYPNLAITAGDLVRLTITEQLAEVREHVRATLVPERDTPHLATDREEWQREYALLYDDDFFAYVCAVYRDVARELRVVDHAYEHELLSQNGVVVYESSHGVLSDRYSGWYPHVSKIRTLPQELVWNELNALGYDGVVTRLAVSRAYQIRHGAGPMPSEDIALRDRLLPGSVSEYDRYRGAVRVGALDTVAMRYALTVAGGAESFDGVVVMCFDQVVEDGVWQVVSHYEGVADRRYVDEAGEIVVRAGVDVMQIGHQRSLAQALYAVEPVVERYEVPFGVNREEYASLVASVVDPALSVPLQMVSFGPTPQDKVWQ